MAAPWLPLDELAPLLAAAGLRGIDLVCHPARFDPARAPGFWDNNAAVLELGRLDFLAPHVARLLAEWGLRATALACPGLPDDEAELGRLLAAVRALDCPLLRWPAPRPEPGRIAEQWRALRQSLARAAARALDAGVRLAVETRDGTLVAAPSAALRLVEGLDPRAVGVAYDIASTAREGCEAPAVAVAQLGPYLAHVLVRDVWLRSGGAGWTGIASGYAPLGCGSIRWPALLAMLAAARYPGWLCLENCTGLDLGPARIARDAAWAREALAAIADSEA